MEKNKVMIIGLDGAGMDLIGPWMKEGKLPVLAEFFEKGSWGRLKSVPNMNSAPAWSSMVTGMNPGKHGIFWFRERQAQSVYTQKLINASFRHGREIWRILSEKGKKVVVVNVPISFPAISLNGFMISGIDSPSVKHEGFCYPPQLYNEIVDKVGSYHIVDEMTSYIKAGKPKEGIASLHETLESRFKTLMYLMDKPWDFFMAVFTETDRIQHLFWKYLEPLKFGLEKESNRYKDEIFKVYRRLDGMIGELEEKAGKETRIIIVSDHGAEADNRRSRFIPIILEYLGLMKFKTEKSLENRLKKKWGNIFSKGILFIDKKFKRGFKKSLVNLFPGVVKTIKYNIPYLEVDWSSTRAFSDGASPEIWINLKGRQHQGIVSPGKEYDELCDEIINSLMKCKDMNSGKPVFGEIFRKEDVYWGNFVAKSPDIILQWNSLLPEEIVMGDGGIISFGMSRAREHPLDKIRCGGHSLFGIFFAKGPVIRSSSNLDVIDITDVAPTVLYLMGFPIPDDMDGKVIESAIEIDYYRNNPPKIISTKKEALKEKLEYSEVEASKIEKQLKDLGYID